jgi:hypothetical protein
MAQMVFRSRDMTALPVLHYITKPCALCPYKKTLCF